MGTATSGFLTWFSTWGSVIYALAQVLFWAAVAFAAVYAAMAYRRLVDHKIARHSVPVVKPGKAIDIDEFVE